MRTTQTRKKLFVITGGILLGLSLIAWSPTDNKVVIGTNTTTDFIGFVAGASNTVKSQGGYAAVVGNANTADIVSTVIGGQSNTIANGAASAVESLRFSGVFGYGHTIPKSRDSLLVGGKYNSINAIGTLVCGNDNDVAGPDTSGAPSYHSAAIGSSNEVFSNRGWAIGHGNEVDADYGAAIGTSNAVTTDATFGVAIGTGTLAKNPSSTALGKYNEEMIAGDVLVIGSGSSSLRHTALRITDDGGVILGSAQGDISMGNYGN